MLKKAPRWTFCSCFFHHPGTFGKSRAEQAVTPEQMCFHTSSHILTSCYLLSSSPWSSSRCRICLPPCHATPLPFLLALLPFVSVGHPQLPDSDTGVVPRFFQVHYFITLSQSALFNYTLYGCLHEHLEQRDKAGGEVAACAGWMDNGSEKRDGVLFTDNRFT